MSLPDYWWQIRHSNDFCTTATALCKAYKDLALIDCALINISNMNILTKEMFQIHSCIFISNLSRCASYPIIKLDAFRH